MLPRLRDWPVGSNLYDSSHHQEPVDALRQLSAQLEALGGDEDKWAYHESFLAVLTLNGPKGEEDFSTPAYWFKRQFVKGADDPNSDPIETDDDLSDPPPTGTAQDGDDDSFGDDDSPDGTTVPIGIATNLAEISAGTHRMRVDDSEVVLIHAWWGASNGKQDGDEASGQQKRYFFNLPPYTVRVRPTAFVASATGKYTGVFAKTTSDYISDTGDITNDDFGDAGGPCLILNRLELHRTNHVHILYPTNCEYPGQIIGSEDDGIPVVEIWAGPDVGELFRVTLTKTGGSDGSSSTLPSYVYTVTGENGETLGTSIAPESRLWTAGTFSPATKGQACYQSDGSLVLTLAYEARTVTPCS